MDADYELPLRWELRPVGAFAEFEPEGLRICLRPRGRGEVIPYADMTHVDVSRSGLWLASKRTTMLIVRTQFRAARGPETLANALRWRLAEEPGGARQLAAMLDVAERARHPWPRRSVPLVAAICVAVFGLEFRDPMTVEVGAFAPALVQAGELWRIATANFLHALSVVPLHLAINVLCLLAFGLLVERPLGAVRTFLVMAASGLGAMLGSAVAGYDEVVGASGIVAGLAGSVLSLELAHGNRLPAWWRLPRRLFIAVLILQVGLDLVLPFVAAGAHLGGFAAGFLVTPLLAAGALDRKPVGFGMQWAAAGVVIALLLSFVSAGRLLAREGEALASHGLRLLTLSDVEPLRLNDLAWRMVTESELEPDAVRVAIELAERAVERTERDDPDVLDTLAEVLFVSGDESRAVDVIDEAILLTGGEEYFREQRRRVTGVRGRDDRPAPPSLPWSFRRQLRERFETAPGLEI